jgi:glyoxylase-like metal-dependent hydrolase (beta-lactamase superfamily II)
MTRELKVSGILKLLMSVTRPLFQAKPAPVDEFLDDGQVLPLVGGLQVVSTIGHTPGHISLYAPSIGVLFSGDSIIARDSQLRGSTGMNTWDQAKANASVKKQAALGARIVCCGHGTVVLDAAGKFP